MPLHKKEAEVSSDYEAGYADGRMQGRQEAAYEIGAQQGRQERRSYRDLDDLTARLKGALSAESAAIVNRVIADWLMEGGPAKFAVFSAVQGAKAKK